MSPLHQPVAEYTSGGGRLIVGALGGLSAVLVKYLSQDHSSVITFFSTYQAAHLPLSAIITIIGGYFILTPILVFLGAIIGWVSNEPVKMKIFALGVSAPALVTTLSNGDLKSKTAFLEPTSATAQTSSQDDLSQGLSSFFGGTDRPYAIYVGSFQAKDRIDRILGLINDHTKNLHAITTEFTDPNGVKFQRIYIIQLFSLKEALDAREKLLKSGVVDEATITIGTKKIAGVPP